MGRASAMATAAALLAAAASAVLAAEVRYTASAFVRDEAARIVRALERERLVRWTRAGSLVLANPSADVAGSFAALGEPAHVAVASAFATASDGGRYGIARLLVGQGEVGHRVLADILRRRELKGRQWALAALQGAYSRPIVAGLRDLVRDPQNDVAERAILELGETEDDRGLRLLRDLAGGPDPGLAHQAALALAFQKDATGVPRLIASLETIREPLRLFKVIQALGSSGAPEAAESLVSLVVRGARAAGAAEPPARLTADFGLRRRGMSASAHGMLLASQATAGLVTLGARGPRPQVVALLAHANAQVRRMAIEVLAACGDDSAVPALVALVERTADSGAHAHAHASTGAAGEDPGAEALLAAQALRAIADPGARGALQSLRGRARMGAASAAALGAWLALALAATGDPGGVEEAVRLARGEDEELAAAAISTLGRSESPQARALLADVVASGSSGLHLIAASSLSRPGNGWAARPLSGLLDRSRLAADARGQSVAALGLGLVGDARHVAVLVELLRSPDGSVRRAAAIGLFYLTGTPYRYSSMWGEEGPFEPTTFHVKLREERERAALRGARRRD
jgi:HEAT repeat protein